VCLLVGVFPFSFNNSNLLLSDLLAVHRDLQHLNLSDNLLATIPAAVPTFLNLQTIDIRRNKICHIHVLYILLRCPALTVVRIDGNPLREKKDVRDKILSLRDAQLIDYIRSLESRKDLRADNSLCLMLLGEGNAGFVHTSFGFA
jgi:hypothetical protein